MQTGVVAGQDAVGKLKGVSVVIPVYNQGMNIARAIQRIVVTLDSALVDYELVVVNDGSTDNTLEVLQKEYSSNQKIKIISYMPNKGKGFAVKTGVHESHGNIIIFTDGDLDIYPEVILQYIRELDSHDLVIASKHHPLSKVQSPLSRKFLSKAFNLFVRVAVGINLKDTQSGLKAGNGDVLRTIFKIMLVKRFAFDVELLTVASIMNLNIKELPVSIEIRRGFKLREITKMFVDVLAISYRYHIIHWYQKRIQFLSTKTH